VHCIDIAASEEGVVFGFQNACIGHMSMASLYIGTGEQAMCSILSGGFHGSAITGLDIAVHRPIVASASRIDSAVRIWNYNTRQCELAWEFAGDEPIGLALHPFGYLLAVSFNDKIRCFQVLIDELKLHREFSIRGVRHVKFSNGGQFLAAAQGKLVLVFSTRTLTKISTLRGHAHQVTSLSFDPEDLSLSTCGEDGALYEWSTHTWTRVNDHVATCSEFISCSVGAQGHAYCGVTDGPMSFLRGFKHCVPVPDQDLEIPGAARVGALCHCVGSSGSATFAGTSTGSLIVCPEATPLAKLAIGQQLGLHSGACAFLCLASDCRTLITAGEDGAIFVLNVNGLMPLDDSATTESESRLAMADIVLINRSELQMRQEEILLLSSENLALQAKLAEEAANLEAECRSKVAEERKKDQDDICEMRRRYENLQQATTSKEREGLRMMKSIESSHTQAAEHLECTYEKTLSAEAGRFVALEAAGGEAALAAGEAVARRGEGRRDSETQGPHRFHAAALRRDAGGRGLRARLGDN